MRRSMMFISLLTIVSAFVLLPCSYCSAQGISSADIVRELSAMKARLNELEKEIQKRDERIKGLETRAARTDEELSHTRGHAAGRVPMETKDEGEKGDGVKWTDKIKLSGLIEVEGSSERLKTKGASQPELESSRRDDNMTLATVELGAEIAVNKYVSGNIRLLYEQDETDLTVDEGTITIGGVEETMGFYAVAGRYYPHFGELNTWFVSDPLTLEIFEIQETAAQVGWKNDWFTTGLGAFRGDVLKVGEDESRIKGFFADVHFHNPEGTLAGISVIAGMSYLNNVGETDTLQDADGLDGKPVKDRIGGAAGYLTVEYDRFSLGLEYISAFDSFEAGEMNYALDRDGSAKESRPAAWNFELAFRPIERLQLAGKYEGSKDMFVLFPESQFGLCVSYEIFDSTVISGEYLHGKYDDNNLNSEGSVSDTRDLFTVQLAVEF